jgi:hypothetical protein
MRPLKFVVITVLPRRSRSTACGLGGPGTGGGVAHDGSSRSAAIRQAVLEAASRRERAVEMRRDVLRMNLGQPDGVNVAEELTRDRAGER